VYDGKRPREITCHRPRAFTVKDVKDVKPLDVEVDQETLLETGEPLWTAIAQPMT
jgi:hypothetical protein